jgi:uncharacterized protein YkwD
LERTTDPFEHGLRDPRGIAAFEANVILDAHAGEQRDLFAAQAHDPPTAADPVNTRVITAVNAVRAKWRRGPVKEDAKLSRVASEWSAVQAKNGTMGHNDLNVLTAAWGATGECVAPPDYKTPEAAVAAWEKDGAHIVILLGKYTVAGVGHTGNYWTLDLASP